MLLTSFVLVTDQKQFDEIFHVAMVMGDKSHRLAQDPFKSNVVVAPIKRGHAFWGYKVEGVSEKDGVVELRYTATENKTEATFTCPLIVSIPKGKYTAIQFVENGKEVKTMEMGKEGGAAVSPNHVQMRRTGKSNVEIQVSSDRPFPVVNAGVVLYIGQQKSRLSRYPEGKMNTLVFTMPADDFAKTKDGDAITVRYEPDSQGHWEFGALDKKAVAE